MAFFKKSGNGRGVFSDKSVDELKSLFTNDDEKDASCPCALEDNAQNPLQPTSCQPADILREEITIDNFTTARSRQN